MFKIEVFVMVEGCVGSDQAAPGNIANGHLEVSIAHHTYLQSFLAGELCTVSFLVLFCKQGRFWVSLKLFVPSICSVSEIFVTPCNADAFPSPTQGVVAQAVCVPSHLSLQYCLRSVPKSPNPYIAILPLQIESMRTAKPFQTIQAAATSSTSISVVVRFPLSVVRPLAFSASFWEYGSSRSCLTLQSYQSLHKFSHVRLAYLRLCTLPFWCALKLVSLSKNFAHSVQ
jgi:hypothetical protein